MKTGHALGNHDYPLEADLPRLNIAFFCESKHLYDVAGQASVDRRLKKSKISIFSGGIAGAVEAYSDKPTPDLLIIESNLPVVDLLAELENLAEVCDPSTKVMIAGDINDVDMYRELIRQGISEYLVMPTTPGKMIESLSHIYQGGDSAPLARSIAFIGAVGGAGTSIIAQNFAVSLASDHKVETCFIDLDTAYGSSAMNWNIEPKRTLKDLTDFGKEADDTAVKNCLMRVSENLNLLGSPIMPAYNVDSLADNQNILENIFCSTRRLSDMVVMDIPSGELSSIRKSAIMSACDVFLVSLPTVRGIRNVSILYHALCEMRPNDAPPKIILSQMGNPDVINLSRRVIIENLGRDPDYYVQYAPEPIDRAVAEGLSLADVSGGEGIMQDIQACVHGLFGRVMVREEPKGLQKFLKDLLKN